MEIELSPDVARRLELTAKIRGINPNDLAIQLIEEQLAKRDQATLDLLAKWRAEDATTDTDELARRERETDELLRSLDGSASGQP